MGISLFDVTLGRRDEQAGSWVNAPVSWSLKESSGDMWLSLVLLTPDSIWPSAWKVSKAILYPWLFPSPFFPLEDQ